MTKSRVQLATLILTALLSVFAFPGTGPAKEKTKPEQAPRTDRVSKKRLDATPTSSEQSSADKAKDRANLRERRENGNELQKDQEGDNIHAQEHSELKNQLAELEKQLAATVKMSDPIGYLNDTTMLLALAVLTFLAIGLHVAQVFLQMNTRQRVTGLQRSIQRLSVATRNTETRADKVGKVEPLREQPNQQPQEYKQIIGQLEQVDNRLAESGKQMVDTIEALALTVQWIGQSQINRLISQAEDQPAEEDRAQMIDILERYKDVFSFNAEVVRPLSEELRSFVERLKTRPHISAELTGRAQALYQRIQQIDRWRSDLNQQQESLQRSSLADRLSTLRADQAELAQRFDSRAISMADYVRGYHRLLDHHFPKDAKSPPIKLSPAECEAELRSISTSAPVYLMNWFDDLFQFRSLVAGAQESGSEAYARTAAELVEIQKIATDVLGKFDIQPEEILIGLTSFDRRLHDAELIAQSAQFPANTVIGVNQCGFRKVSTGEALRRPKVIVAGVGAV